MRRNVKEEAMATLGKMARESAKIRNEELMTDIVKRFSIVCVDKIIEAFKNVPSDWDDTIFYEIQYWENVKINIEQS